MPLNNNIKYGIFILFGLIVCFSFNSKRKELIRSSIKINAIKSEKDIHLICESAEIYNNGSFTIDYKMKQNENTLFIEFKNISIPKKANKNLEPARSVINLGNLKERTYKLMICTKRGIGLSAADTNKNSILQKDSAQLIVSKNNVQLICLSHNSIE